MANRVTTWSTSQVLASADLNGEFNNIYTGTVDRSGGRWGNNDDTPISLGSSQDAQLEWDTAQTTDCVILGLGSGNIFSVMEKGDMATNWGIGSQTNPTLFVHSADASATSDYIALTHDQTNANITAGTGSLVLNGDVVIKGTTPTLTIGDAGTEDTAVVFDGNAVDFYVGLDDTADDFVIGLGSAVGTNPAIIINGDGSEEVRFGAAGTNDGLVHIISPAADKVGLVVEMPSSASANCLQTHYNGTSAIDLFNSAGATCVCLNSRDIGNDVLGPQVNIGRNTNGTQASGGNVKFHDLGGTAYFVHSDDSGKLRIGTTDPIGSADTSNTIVGTQSSFQFHPDGSPNKIKLRDITPDEGLELVNDSSFTVGKYADGSYNGSDFVWPYAEECPWFMTDPYGDYPGGRSHSSVSHSSLNSLAIKALYDEIQKLKAVTP